MQREGSIVRRLRVVSTSRAAVVSLILLVATVVWSKPTPNDKAVDLNLRGIEHLDRQEYDAAIKLFRDALKIQPDYPEALDNLGNALDAEGKGEEAVVDFQKAIKLASDNAIAYNDMGHALFHEKKYQESPASYRQAISIHDNYPEAYNGLGAALLHAASASGNFWAQRGSSSDRAEVPLLADHPKSDTGRTQKSS